MKKIFKWLKSLFKNINYIKNMYLPHKKRTNLRLDIYHSEGNITVSNSDTLNPSYSDVSKIFDFDNTISSMIVLNNDGDPSWTNITLDTSLPNSKLPQKASYIELHIGVALKGRVVINEGESDETTAYWDTGRTSYDTTSKKMFVRFPTIQIVRSIKIYYDEFEGVVNLRDARLYGVYLYNVPTISDFFEFNDSVLSTKAWNSSRYNGKQLEGATINEFTIGDSTYGKTPVLQNYTRNIYIGNSILNLSGSTDTGAVDNNFLSPFPNFSYVTINDYITINDDNSITRNTIDVRANNVPSKVGFYRAFYEDFPVNSFCNIVSTNTKVKTSLENQYKIYFNGGQLRRILELGTTTLGAGANISYNTSSNLPTIEAAGGTLIGTATVYDEDYIRKTGYAKDLNIFQAPFNAQTNTSYHELFNSLFTFKSDSPYKGDKRLFFSFIGTGSSDSGRSPIRTLSTGSIPVDSTIPLATENLSELSTIELGSISGEPTISEPDIVFSSSFNTTLNQNYNTGGLAVGPAAPEICASILISRVEDANPSLLLNLNKEEVFPDGLSNTNFVIIPENLHPFVKDNLIYFLIRAGVDVGGNTSPLIELNNNNFNLP